MNPDNLSTSLTEGMAPPLHRRVWWCVPLAAMIILALCVARMQRPQGFLPAVAGVFSLNMPAPQFEGYDSNNQFFRLVKYLGRHRVLLIFFDGSEGIAESESVLKARQEFAAAVRRNAKIVAVSTALPQKNRAEMQSIGPLPFEVVTDTDGSIHRKWGMWDETTRQPRTGVFLIDRKGSVKFSNSYPQPYNSISAALKDLES